MQSKKCRVFFIIIIKMLCLFTNRLALKTNSSQKSNDAEKKEIFEDNSDNNNSHLKNETVKRQNAETYMFSHNLLKFYNDDGNSTYSFDELHSTEAEVAIKELNIIKSCNDSLVIQWSVDNENISMYLIEWFDEDVLVGREMKSFPDPSNKIFNYTILSLTACYDYKIIVTPQFGSEVGKSKVVNGTTAKTQPGAPSILIADPVLFSRRTSLNVSWDEPLIGHNCIGYYEITLNAEIHGNEYDVQEYTPSTNIMMRHLFPCTSYLVTVKAVDHDGLPGLPKTFTASPTFSGPNIEPKLNNTSPPFKSTQTTITLHWNVLDPKNNCTIESVLTECKYIYTEGYGFDVKDYGKTVSKIDNENGSPSVVQAVVTDLSPFTNYYCRARISNKDGNVSNNSVDIHIVTKDLAPSPPKKLNVVRESNSKLTFSWQPPAVMPGLLQEYKITISWKPLYLVPSACSTVRQHVSNSSACINNTYTWLGEDGYSNCTAYIAAQTRGGWSKNSEPIYFVNAANGAPSQVTNLTYLTRSRVNDTNALETILTWNLPCFLRGRFKHFAVRVHGWKKNYENHCISLIVELGSDFQNDDLISINLGELKPEYFYKYEVAAVNHDARKKGDVAKFLAKYPAAIPPSPPEYYLKIITLSPETNKPTTTSVEILLPLFSDSNGDIRYYAIMISQLGAKYQPARTRFDLKSSGWPNVSSWRESMERDFQIPYQATEPSWTPYPNYIINYGSIKAVKFIVGNDNRCKDVSSTTKRQLYCNGPLKPDTWYEIRMRAFTTGGYSDSPPIIVKTDKEVSVALVIGIVFGILLLGVTVALLLSAKLYFNRNKEISNQQENDESVFYSSRHVITNINPQAYDTSIMRSRRH